MKIFLSNVKLFLVVIILLAAILRVYRVSDAPPSLNWDEISHGYNAYSILKTGKDEWGQFMPIIFRAYGDYKLPVYIYITSLSEFFFGLNEFSVRLPSVAAGIGIVVTTYFLVFELFKTGVKNKGSFDLTPILPMLAALFVAIEPWTLFISRAAFEANMGLFFFVFGTYSFLKNINSKKKNYFLSLVSFGLSVWSYNSYRVFTPLMITLLAVIYRNQLVSDIKSFQAYTKVLNMGIIVLFFVPMFYQLFSTVGNARYQEVRILDSGMVSRINEARSSGGSRIIHNKVSYFVLDFLKNYVSHFSPEFIFTKGGSHYQFSVPGHGLLYPINLLVIIGGIYFLFFKGEHLSSKSKYLIIGWIALAPIPSSLTREAPHVLRAVTLLPIPMILSAMGIGFLLTSFNSFSRKIKLFTGLGYSFVILFSLVGYLSIYFGEYRNNYSWSWQYPYKNVVNFVDENYEKYDKIIVTKKYGEAHEFFLFYLKWEPQKYVNDPNLIRFYQSNWYWVDSFDKFYFVNDWQINENGKGEYVFNLENGSQVTCPLGESKCLLITSPSNVPKGWSKVSQFKFLNDDIAFEIYENN